MTLYTIIHNWRIAITKLTNKLSKLRYRTLSLRSQIWFLAILLHIPKWAITAIEKQIFTFLCDDKRMDPIKRKTLYLPPELSGLGILHPLLQSQALTLKDFMYITEENKQTKWHWSPISLAKVRNNLHTPQDTNHTDSKQNSEETIPNTTNRILRTEFYKQHTITSENIWDRTFHTILPWKKLWTHLPIPRTWYDWIHTVSNFTQLLPYRSQNAQLMTAGSL